MKAQMCSLCGARYTEFTAINVCMSPVGLAVFLCFSVGLGWSATLAFIPMTLVTTPMSYLAHRKKSFNGNGLRWRINLHRWAWLRLGAFLAGLAIVDVLTSVGVPGLGAVIINGVAQAIPYYLISKWWALAEVEGLKA